MAQAHDEPVAAVAQRIRQAYAAAMPCGEARGLTDGGANELCRLDLIDAVEEATDYEMTPCQAGRIADAVLKLLRRHGAAPAAA